MTEIWRSVPSYEGRYEASSYGRIRSVSRLVSSPRHGKGATRLVCSRILSQQTLHPYFGVTLVHASGEKVRRNVHRVIAETFVPNPDSLPVVNHLDADGYNNRSDNLEWCTVKHNVEHSYKIGNRPTGKDHHFAKMKRDIAGRVVAGGGWDVEEF